MPPATMTARVMKQSKHREYRRNVKARAIALKGGRCEQCGFADEQALRFHHTRPVLPMKSTNSSSELSE